MQTNKPCIAWRILNLHLMTAGSVIILSLIHKSAGAIPCMFGSACQLPDIVVKDEDRTTGNCGFGDVYQ